MSLLEIVARLGGVASRRQLGVLGFGRHVIDSALEAGELLPIRPGWVGSRSANQLAVTAVLQGGRLTGATALRSYGVWAGSDLRVRIQLERDSHRRLQHSATPIHLFRPPQHRSGEIVLEWAPHSPTAPGEAAWRVTLADALVRFAKRESDEQIVSAVESAVHERLLSRAAVASLFVRLPRRLRRLLARLNFLSESGLESIGRFRLEDLGFHLEPQVQIGPDRVDLLIDGWLVIELDGDRWHDPVKDRRRTNRLIRAGYRVLRFGYFDVIEQWEVTLATIRELHGERSGRMPRSRGSLEAAHTPVAGRSARASSGRIHHSA